MNVVFEDMNLQQGDLTEENIKEAVGTLKALIKSLVDDTKSKYGGEYADNIMKGTLCKFIARMNTLLLHLKLLLECVYTPSKLDDIAVLSFIHKEVAIAFFKMMRQDFFVGIFSFCEDACVYGLAPKIFTPSELGKIEMPIEYEALLIDKEIGHALQKRIDELVIEKPFKYLSLSRIVRKLEGKKMLSKEDASFLIACSKIRNSIHANGMNEPFGENELLALQEVAGEKFVIDSSKSYEYITLKRTVEWADQIVKLFRKVAEQTEWAKIKDNTI